MRVVGAVVLGFCLTFVSLAAGLPDSRVYEQVSPAAKNGYSAGATAEGQPAYSIAGPDEGPGQPLSVLYGNTGALGSSSTSGVDVLSVARRSQTGWSSVATTPRNVGQMNLDRSAAGALEPSIDLTRLLFTSDASFGAGNPDTQNHSGSIYLAETNWLTGESVIASWVGRPTIKEPDPALGNVEYSSRLRLAGGNETLSDIYFTYYGTLTEEDTLPDIEEQSRAKLLKEAGGANSSGAKGNWGFYEWREGALTNAGELPAGSPFGPFDPYGAVPAATVQRGNSGPNEYDNQVSSEARVALFVSPAPDAKKSGRTPELYARVRNSAGEARSVLVSYDELLPQVGGAYPPAPTGPVTVTNQAHMQRCGEACISYAFASADGSQVFFASNDALTQEALSGLGLKTYRFDTTTGALTYLPGVKQPVVGVSGDGSEVLFENQEKSPMELDLWSGGQVRTVAPLGSPTVETEGNKPCLHLVCIGPVRFVRNGGVAVFATDAVVPGFNDAGGFEQIYRFDISANELSCVSCPSTGASAGDAVLSNNDQYVERKGDPVDNRSTTSDGSKVFFDTPSALVPQDVNGRRDVYEWENGRVYLISTGTGPHDSFFLDNTPSGNDVFFTTSDGLVTADGDEGYDVYDARVNGGLATEATAHCEENCQSPASAPPVFSPGQTATVFGEGNLAPAGGSLGASVKATPKPKKKSKRKPKHGKRRARKGSRARKSDVNGVRRAGR
ncbi:MAG TPA: hypothetical protein VID29_10560 [Solirubrobacteraceae bacterium]|jgi:hypothetical protein